MLAFARRTIGFSSSKCKSKPPCVNRGNKTIGNRLLIQISIWVFVIMAFPLLLCNYMPALFSSKVHITSVVINMCEWVWMCQWVYVTGRGGLTAQGERACGWPITLNVHWGGLIIRNNASGECDTWVYCWQTSIFISVEKQLNIFIQGPIFRYQRYSYSFYCAD